MFTDKNTNRTKKLITALESGKYKKTTGVLKRPGYGRVPETYCVEGVMCDLFRKSTKRGRWVMDSAGYNQMAFEIEPDSSHNFGFQTEVREYFFNSNLALWPKNDAGWSFVRIAKYLRKKFDIND